MDNSLTSLKRFRTLRNADIRRLRWSNISHSLENAYQNKFYNYDIKGKSYDEIVEYFTSPEAYVGHHIDIPSIRLCLARAYYKGRLTGIEYLLLFIMPKETGLSIGIASSPSSFSSSRLSGCCFALGMNPAIHEIINHRIINLQFDKSCKIKYTDRYLKGDGFKPVDIVVSKPYSNAIQDTIFSGGSGISPEDMLKVTNKLAWLQQQNLVDYMDTKLISDFSQRWDVLSWKEDIQ